MRVVGQHFFYCLIRFVSIFFFIFILSLSSFTAQAAGTNTESAAAPGVQWYPVETEKSKIPHFSKIIISGLTRAFSRVQIDGDTITVLKSLHSLPPMTSPLENVRTISNREGFFQIEIDLPQGLLQLPVQVTTPERKTKSFLLTFDVNVIKDEVKMGAKITPDKPPAAAKRIRLWAGLGGTYQNFSQTSEGATDLKFQTMQAPAIVARGGYWGKQWGLDFYFRDAPGKITADTPLTVQTDSYHWRTMEAKGLYQFDRGPKSRIGGLASQWQLRFGFQQHDAPFLQIQSGNVVSLDKANLTMATLGTGLLLNQEQGWSYEFALSLQQGLTAGGPGTDFKASSLFGYEAQIGAAYKISPAWRLGIFSYTQSLSYAYSFRTENGIPKAGKQNLFYTTFDLRLGYEF